MKIYIYKTITDSQYKIEIKLEPSIVEKDLFNKFGEPMINIDGGLNFKALKKIYSDNPIILKGTDFESLINLKNQIIEDIRIELNALRAKDTSYIGDEILEL